MPRFDITIAGELNLDLILYGLPQELPPERESLAERMMLTLGSSSAIVAHNLAALGTRVGFISRIGDDLLGQMAVERIEDAQVDVSKLHRSAGATTGLTVILQKESGRQIITYLGTIAELIFDDLDLEYLVDARHFHFSSYYLQRGLRPRVADLFRELKHAGLTISLDTNDDPDDSWDGSLEQVLPYVDVFLPNAREARKIARVDDLEAAVRHLSKSVPVLVVKLGAKGALAQRGNERLTSPPVAVHAIDPVGAGDSFNAGFLAQYVRGADLGTCLVSGNYAGAFSTTRAGGTEAFRDREYVTKFFPSTLTAPAWK
ncbi:MAG: ribokinase [Acidobacteria bacterium]|nr:MAG: ribokinase [Acidobacteriota bacterium]